MCDGSRKEGAGVVKDPTASKGPEDEGKVGEMKLPEVVPHTHIASDVRAPLRVPLSGHPGIVSPGDPRGVQCMADIEMCHSRLGGEWGLEQGDRSSRVPELL